VNEDIPAEIRHAVETQFIVRTLIKATLKRSIINPDVLIKAGYTVDAETKDYWAWWSKRLGDRFFDMGTLIRAAAGLETGLRDYFRKKKGLPKLKDLRRLLEKDKCWNGAVFQRIFTWNSPRGAQELFQEEVGYDLQSNDRLPQMQELILHRHLYAHCAGLLDDEYIEKWRRLTGEDLAANPSVRDRYPSEDVYWFRPLRRLGDYINSANQFFQQLP
jgi:hypothetical protein